MFNSFSMVAVHCASLAQTAQEQYDLGQKFMDRATIQSCKYFNVVHQLLQDDPLLKWLKLPRMCILKDRVGFARYVTMIFVVAIPDMKR